MMRNALALIVAVLLGGAVNMGLILAGATFVPPPAGVDITDAASIAASIDRFELKHFVFPLLAHALGTLAGAAVAFAAAGSHPKLLAFIVGGVFLLGGIANAFMIPAPVWFVILDLIAAYLPMAWLGSAIGRRFRSQGTASPA